VIPENLSKLKIVHYPDPVLRRQCEPVEEFGPALERFVDRMFELMRLGEGVGLAAPQVGVLARMFVCNYTGEPGDNKVYINPVLSQLEGAEEKEEGCLSLPDVYVMKRRATSAIISAYDVQGQPFTEREEGLLVRVWQHETDHLGGQLLVDHMSATDEIANRQAVKQLKEIFARSR